MMSTKTCANCKWEPDYRKDDPQYGVCKYPITFNEDKVEAHNQHSQCPKWEPNIGYKINRTISRSLPIMSNVLFIIGAFILIKHINQLTIIEAGILSIVSPAFFQKDKL